MTNAQKNGQLNIMQIQMHAVQMIECIISIIILNTTSAFKWHTIGDNMQCQVTKYNVEDKETVLLYSNVSQCTKMMRWQKLWTIYYIHNGT